MDLHALHFAACCNNAKALSALLDLGCHPDVRDGDGWTPLCFAAVHGHDAAVEVLLRGRADVNALTDYHSTPLILAGKPSLLPLEYGVGFI